MQLISEYLLFFAKIVTIIIAIVILVSILMAQRKKTRLGSLEIKDLSDNYTQVKETMLSCIMSPEDAKAYSKQKQKQKKLELKAAKLTCKLAKKTAKKNQKDHVKKAGEVKAKLYVLSFNGSVDASEVENLREEITAILSVITAEDKVAIKLESPGGVVHGYGLAASQLMRFRERNIDFSVIVDKLAASGGYMMACTASKIIAAPFAIIGSIGVVAQMPNFHRLLKKNDIDVELQTAGKYKRTLTMFGENTNEGRQKFKEELEDVYDLFKRFVQKNRPHIDIEQVATGEHWFATQAKENGLVDEIGTSDDFILSHLEDYKILSVEYRRQKKLADRIVGRVMEMLERRFFHRDIMK